ncbi:TetR/AcrR family transcriptional regulator [Schaalia sp. 19OD2882]|uniref:TetR/AcrR family transcriptional regulator n=1 Tax=Schaalia sp. 19OD2882 TaxID=2794089 RepID=UPI001C1EF829|nr:TetR/AcrR family transcriptional regulator [Schaalia sp. 19OD2882]QWW19668.1 TetR/AcrR family transcriptional regulator [Schaalia sp. 19OD2882]
MSQGNGAKRGPGRPRAGSEDKRARVLAEALTLFSTRGYAGTSLGEVANAADISKAGLLHHFSSKDALFAAVLEERDRKSIEVHGDSQFSDVRQVLSALVETVRANAKAVEGTALYVAMTGAVVSTDHPAHDWFAQHLSAAVTMLERAFEDGKAAGTVRPDAPSRRIARAIVALADGLQVQMACARAERLAAPEADPDLPYDADLGEEFAAAIAAVMARWLVDGAQR